MLRIWPPEHQWAGVGPLGVTDPEGGPVTIQVTGVRQDEPVDGHDDGHVWEDHRPAAAPTSDIYGALIAPDGSILV